MSSTRAASAPTRRRTPITREEIVEAAASIAAQRGIDEVTIRAIATKLSVAPMTLYGHVRSKDDILDAIADVAMGTVRLETDGSLTVREAVTDVASTFLQIMRDHPAVVRLISSRITTSQESHRGAMESVLHHLKAADLPDELCVRVYGTLIMYAMGFASYQAPRPWGRNDDPESTERARQLSHIYAGFPSTEFPHTVAMAQSLVRIPEDATFWFAVDALITKIERELASSHR